MYPLVSLPSTRETHRKNSRHARHRDSILIVHSRRCVVHLIAAWNSCLSITYIIQKPIIPPSTERNFSKQGSHISNCCVEGGMLLLTVISATPGRFHSCVIVRDGVDSILRKEEVAERKVGGGGLWLPNPRRWRASRCPHSSRDRLKLMECRGKTYTAPRETDT